MENQKIYTKEELNNKKVGTLRTIARDLKIKNYTTFQREKLIDQIVDAQQTMINAGLIKLPEPEPEPEEPLYSDTDAVFECEFDDPSYSIDEETGEVIENKPVDEFEPQPVEKSKSKVETQKVEQIGLDLNSKIEKKIEENPEKHELTEEELQAQRRASVEKYRQERGYVPPEEKKKREPIGGEELTRALIIVVPIAALLAIYCGLEAIIFVISKLWYGELAYVPVNLVPKIIVCVISTGIIEFAKYAQKFDTVVDHYASKLKKKEETSQ